MNLNPLKLFWAVARRWAYKARRALDEMDDFWRVTHAAQYVAHDACCASAQRGERGLSEDAAAAREALLDEIADELKMEPIGTQIGVTAMLIRLEKYRRTPKENAADEPKPA